jgi:hypothetical protein
MKTVTPLINPDTGQLDPALIPQMTTETDPVFSAWQAAPTLPSALDMAGGAIVNLPEPNLPSEPVTLVAGDKRYAALSDFTHHVDTDIVRWQGVADLRYMVYELYALSKLHTLDPLHTYDILEDASSAAGYAVQSLNGGLLTFTTVATLDAPGQVYVNGELVWSAAGLSTQTQIKDYYLVPYGSLIKCNGINSLTLTPYI